MPFSLLWPGVERYSWMGLAVVAGLGVVDWMLTPGVKKLHVIRSIPDRLSLGDANAVVLTVRNLGSRRIRGKIGDNLPLEFQNRDAIFRFSVRGGEQTRFSYSIRPLRRGKFRFEEVSVEVHGFLGLVRKKYHVPLVTETKCYPSYLQLRNAQLNARRYNLHQLGQKKQRRYGQGREFESLRNYSRNDEYRKINWKATARRGKPIVSQYQVERNQNIVLLLDAGRMMRTHAGDMSKLDYAVNAALMLAYLCLHKEDNVGLLVFGSKTQSWIPPQRGISQLGRINEALYNLEPEMAEPNYQAVLQFLRRKNPRRSLVLLITDLVDEMASDGLIREFIRLYPAHLPLCITLRDLHLEQMATQEPTNAKEMTEMAVAQMLVEDRLRALRRLHLGGVLTLDTDPGSLSADALNKYLDIKAKGMI